MTVKSLAPEIDKLLNAHLLGNFENGSPEWHELRNEAGAVGGSDIAAIAGLSPYESPFTKWAKKTKQIPDEIKPNISMRIGTKLEAPILELFAEEHPELEIYTTGTWANNDKPWARANPDALYKTADGEWGIVEIKFSREYWYDVPQHYRAQVLWYMQVFGIKQAKLVALAGSSYQEFPVEWDEFEVETLMSAAERFRKHVETMEHPKWDGSTSTYESVRQMTSSIEDGEVDLDDLGMYYFLKLDEYNKVEKELTELKSRVLSAMEGKKRGLVYGDHLITLRSRAGGNAYIHHEKR